MNKNGQGLGECEVCGCKYIKHSNNSKICHKFTCQEKRRMKWKEKTLKQQARCRAIIMQYQHGDLV